MGTILKLGNNINSSGDIPWSAYWMTRKPSNIVLTVLSDTSIKVDWTDAAQAADGLKVYFNDVLKATVAFGVQTATIAELTSNTEYSVDVVAYRGTNESDPITATTSTITLPTDITDYKLWIQADSVAGNDGDEITTVTSIEGNAYEFTGAATKRPLLKKAANGINGKSVLRFDGSNDILVNSTAILTGTQGTVYAVVRYASVIKSSQDILASSDEATAFTKTISLQGCKNITNSFPAIYQNSGGVATYNTCDTLLTPQNAYRYKFKSTGAAYEVQVNGKTQTLTDTNNGDWFGDTADRDNTCIGGAKASSEADWFKGDIAEIIAFERALTPAEEVKMEAYLDYRYGSLTLLNFGDSITQGVGATLPQTMWVDIVCKTKGYFPMNSGISSTLLQNTAQNTVATLGGATANNGRDTIANRVTDFSMSKVIILYGLNDLRLNDVAITADLFENDLSEIVDLIIADGVTAQNIIIGSPPYISNYSAGSPYNAGSQAKHQAYTAKCAAVALVKGTKYKDIYQYMIDNGGNTLISGDGIHPNDLGHAAIATAFLSVL